MFDYEPEFAPGDFVRFWGDHVGVIVGEAPHYHPFGDWCIAGVDGQRYVVDCNRMELLTDVPLEMLALQAM